MPYIKEGFKGERIFSLPDKTIDDFVSGNYADTLCVTKIGYFPQVKYHYNNKESGTKYNILLHCVSGHGWFEVDGERRELKSNQFVIIMGSANYAYGADEDDPWTIYWAHFRGSASNKIINTTYLYSDVEIVESSRSEYRIDLFEEIFMNFQMGYIKEHYLYTCSLFDLYLHSFIYQKPFRYISNRREAPSFIEKVCSFLEENVSHSLSVADIASFFGYSVSHFSMLFKRESGCSPMDYFIKLKMRRACRYLELTDLRPSQIYSKLGFNDVAYFTRLFKKCIGVSPSTYRKRERANSCVTEGVK